MSRACLAVHRPCRHLLLAVAGLIVVVLVLQSVSDFRSVQLTSMAYLGIAAGGLTVLTGLNGQISLGHGALMAIGAYTTALFLQDDSPAAPARRDPARRHARDARRRRASSARRPPGCTGPTSPAPRWRWRSPCPGLALYFDGRLGGEQGLLVRLPDIPGWVLDATYFVTGTDLTRSKYVAYIAWITLIITFVLLANLSRSRVGRRWRAVRDDEVAAELAGIHLGRARVSAFIVSAAAAGAAGAVLAIAVRLAAPSGFTLTLSLTLLTAVVLGGLGSLAGALVGAALLTFLPSVVTGVGRERRAELDPGRRADPAGLRRW